MNSTSNFNKIDEISASTTTYTDNAVSSGNEYYYRIEAIWTNSSDHVCRSLPTNYIGPFTVTGGGGGEPCPGTPTVMDEDGNVYNTVLIGSQCWMKENLKVGDMIPGADDMEDDGNIEKYCYNDEPDSCDVYGGLYQWNEMMDYTTLEGTQGICPDGWHLPSDDEWTVLTTFLGGESIAGGKMKEAGTTHWASPNTGATNSSGFTALPGGYRLNYGNFYTLTSYADVWSSTEYSSTGAWSRVLTYSNEYVYRYSGNKSNGFSVRCVQD